MTKQGIIILGAAGLAKEFFLYIKRARPYIREFIFVNDMPDGQTSLEIAGKSYKVVKDWNFKNKYEFVVAVGSPRIKKILVERALAAGLTPAETIVDPAAIVLDGNRLGKGGIISPGCVVTTNVTLGDYVTLNLNTTVGHDTVMGDFCTTNPGVHISGEIQMNHSVECGTGSIIRDRLTMGANKTIGAQAAVVKDYPSDDNEVLVGIPAKKLERRS